MGGGSGLGTAGPLAVFAPGFSAESMRQGYRPRSAEEQLRRRVQRAIYLAAAISGMRQSELLAL